MSAFDWGLGSGGQQTVLPAGDIIPQSAQAAALADSFRQSSLTSFFPPQTASTDSQNNSGLGIQNVKRGFGSFRARYGGTFIGLDFQVNSATWKDVGADLSGSVATSGRPVIIFIEGNFYLNSGTTKDISISIDGNPVADTALITNTGQFFRSWSTTPSSGSHKYSMIWRGNLIMPRSAYPALTVVEL